jgi:hypothetical protein
VGARAVVAGLHLHLVDVHAGLAGVVALEHGVREDAVAAHHGVVVQLGVHYLPHILAAGTCTWPRAEVPCIN